MGSLVKPIQIPLTEDQQELIRRLSGHFAQVLELVPDPADSSSGAGSGLQFRWRLSVATGIPRQQWGVEQGPPGTSSDAAATQARPREALE